MRLHKKCNILFGVQGHIANSHPWRWQQASRRVVADSIEREASHPRNVRPLEKFFKHGLSFSNVLQLAINEAIPTEIEATLPLRHGASGATH
jgi:hypothetical protein